MAPRIAENIAAREMSLGLTIPLPKVWATAVPKNKAPMSSKQAMMKRTFRGSMAPVMTEVTTSVAESFNPLVNSKRRIMAMNPIATIKIWSSKISLSVSLAQNLRRVESRHAGLALDLHPAGFAI